MKNVKRPIYLLLHVPKSKEELPNLKIIIFQIYLFLSAMSDVQIIVLNQKYKISLPLLPMNFWSNKLITKMHDSLPILRT